MNINEECLLLFLNNPGRLEFTTKELKKFIFYANDNVIRNEKPKLKESASFETSPNVMTIV